MEGKIKIIYFLFRVVLNMFFNCRSEANDLAIRLAREFTGNYDILVLDK